MVLELLVRRQSRDEGGRMKGMLLMAYLKKYAEAPERGDRV
jgi:hypothetical protein